MIILGSRWYESYEENFITNVINKLLNVGALDALHKRRRTYLVIISSF